MIQFTGDFGTTANYKQFYFQAAGGSWPTLGDQIWVNAGITGSNSLYAIYTATSDITFSSIQLQLGNLVGATLTAQDISVTSLDVVYIPSANISKVFPTVYTNTTAGTLSTDQADKNDASIQRCSNITLTEGTVAVAVGDALKVTLVVPSGSDLTGVMQIIAGTNADNWGWHATGYVLSGIGTLAKDTTYTMTASVTTAVEATALSFNLGVQTTSASTTFDSLPFSSITVTKYPAF